MKFKIKENMELDFFAGLALFIIGIIVFTKNIYVSTGMFGGGITIGGVYLRSGVCVLPFIAGVVWMFLRPGKLLPKIISGAGFAVILIAALMSVNIRVRAVPLVRWIIILLLVFGGIALMCTSVYLKSSKGKKR